MASQPHAPQARLKVSSGVQPAHALRIASSHGTRDNTISVWLYPLWCFCCGGLNLVVYECTTAALHIQSCTCLHTHGTASTAWNLLSPLSWNYSSVFAHAAVVPIA